MGRDFHSTTSTATAPLALHSQIVPTASCHVSTWRNRARLAPSLVVGCSMLDVGCFPNTTPPAASLRPPFACATSSAAISVQALPPLSAGGIPHRNSAFLPRPSHLLELWTDVNLREHGKPLDLPHVSNTTRIRVHSWFSPPGTFALNSRHLTWHCTEQSKIE